MSMQIEPTDSELILRTLRGDVSAYAVLVKRYQALVFTLVLRYVRHREDAEEVAQDVFVKAFRSLAGFKGESKFSTWLYTIAATTSLTFLRKKRPHVESLDGDGGDALADRLGGGLSANRIEQKSRAALVHDAIKLLSPDDARLITLYYQGEQSIDEIATILRIEPNNAKVKLHRARGRLREKMETYFPAAVRDLT
ncbi:MAG: polymerase sigma factor [Flaviaesturariibacter sp.]|nr:polymerase sigma factor [Flaviaesturariibacter sp.]